MLSLRDVHVHIGKLHILQGVNLEVKPGESAALLGRNGVGKTTTLRAIMGLAPRSRGTVEFEGGDLARSSPIKCRARASAMCRRGAASFPNLSVLENLCIGLPGKRDPEREDYVFELFPAPQGAAEAVGQHAVGRRAADARDRALPDDAAEADHPRRADRRDHAAARVADQARNPPHQPDRRVDPAGRAERRDRAQAVSARVSDGERAPSFTTAPRTN